MVKTNHLINYFGEIPSVRCDRVLKKYGVIPKTASEEKNVIQLNVEDYKSFTLFQYFCIVSRRLVGKNHCDCSSTSRKTNPWLFDNKIVFLCKRCEQFFTDGNIIALGGAIFKIDELIYLPWHELMVLKEYALAMAREIENSKKGR